MTGPAVTGVTATAVTATAPANRPQPESTEELLRQYGLVRLAGAEWPAGPDDGPPAALPGFIISSFSPLVAQVATRCLSERYTQPPAPAAVGERTAIVISSRQGDVATAVEVARRIDTGERVAPLLFYQAVPNAVAGYLAARWGLAGPVVCVSPAGDALAEAVAVAALVIYDGDADEALLVAAEQAGVDSDGEQRTAGGHGDKHDTAAALLVRRAVTGNATG